MLRPRKPVGKPASLVIAGYFGFGNIGDELILTSMLNGLRAQKPDLQITVLSGNPMSTQKTHQVTSVAWQDYPAIVKTISDCDLVILGGGGLFHDYWGINSDSILTSEHTGFAFYSSIAMLASFHNKKLMLNAVGVGPIFSDRGRQLMTAIASQAALITVRDVDSQQQLFELGIPREKITLTADEVFSFAESIASPSKIRENQLVLGVSLRHWNYETDPSKWQHEIALALDAFLDDHHDGAIKFIPFQNSKDAFLDDYALSKSVQNSLRNNSRTTLLAHNASITDIQSAVSQCDLYLGMRLHSIILALMSHLPVIGINYDPKVLALMRQFHLEKHLANVSKLDSQTLINLLEENTRARFDISRAIQKQLPTFRRQANQNHKLANQLINTPLQTPPLQPKYVKLLSDSALGLSGALDLARKQNTTLEKTNLKLNQGISLVLQEKAKLISDNDQMQQELIKLKSKSETERKELQKQTNSISQELLQHQQELKAIKTSRGWKLLFKLWELRLVLIPKGSKRETLMNFIIRPNQPESSQSTQKVARWLERNLSPKLSWPALAFRIYKHKRNQLWSDNLNLPGRTFTTGLVSIVLPVFNGERYIGEAIQSILCQTYPQFELIIVDDGSTDRTPEIIEGFAKKDHRIRVIIQTNRKLPGALNSGFENAHGEFFTWTSDDNLMSPRFLEKMVGCLRRHPSWQMIYANMDLLDEDGNPLKNSGWYEGYQFPHHSEHIYLPTDPSELNLVANDYIGGAFLYRRQVADLLAGYSPFQYTREDYDYWMQVNSLFTLRHTDFKQPVYRYRMHSNSLTSQDAALKITEDRKFLMAFEDFRRDFYLMPLIWVFENDQLENPLVMQIKTTLQKHGQIILTLTDLFEQILPIKWVPCLHIKICSNPKEKEAFLSTQQEYVYSVAALEPDHTSGDSGYDISLAVDHVVQTISESSTDIEASLLAVDIKCRAMALRNIEKQTWQPQPSKYKISVVICTYNRSEQLELSLRAIARQTIPQSDYEVIVVDNNPDHSTLLTLIEQTREWEFFRYPEKLRLIQCPIQGLSYARNAGLSEVHGEWVLFMDDDALAQSDLLEKYLETIECHPEAGLIGGHIELALPDKLEIPWKPGWERYWSHFVTGYSQYTPVNQWYEFPWGANWCAKRLALFQIGGFRGSYGRRGEDFKGGEEIIAASLIHMLGYTIGILPQAKVIHQVDPTRFTLKHLQHTILAGQLVRYQAELDQYLPRDLSRNMNPLRWMKKLQKHTADAAIISNSKDATLNIETAYLISAKRKITSKHLLIETARFKFWYPFFKHLL